MARGEAMGYWRGSLNLARGLRGFFLGAVGGGLAPVVVLGGSVVFNWLIHDPSAFDRRLDVAWLKEMLPTEVVGCATFCAAAGWTAYAPARRTNFARSLCSVFLLTFAMYFATWLVLESMDLNPRRLKGDPFPTLDLPELVFLVASPLAAAALLTLAPMVWRAKNEESPSPKAMCSGRLFDS
ncbi:MAG: hypothetical protein P4L85_08445 [Paludisphaera borealis]|uniref:hypothetical protein n=1 Tax=Paludisphaera borealis TaxID=1387353 RepID=UPI00284CBD7A|nr:hypothetical protein [Paludisphaera borealis]MDR3619366.1 hypothetical protein [Paludisphaera borealis]